MAGDAFRHPAPNIGEDRVHRRVHRRGMEQVVEGVGLSNLLEQSERDVAAFEHVCDALRGRLQAGGLDGPEQVRQRLHHPGEMGLFLFDPGRQPLLDGPYRAMGEDADADHHRQHENHHQRHGTDGAEFHFRTPASR